MGLIYTHIDDDDKGVILYVYSYTNIKVIKY